MTLPLAFSTNAFKQSTLHDAITAIAAAGYTGVEIMADVPHAYPLRFTADQRRELRERLADLNLQVSNVNAFTHFVDGDTYHPTWFEPDAMRRQLRIDHTIAAVELAAELNCRTVSIQPGGPLIGTGLSPEEACRMFATSLAAVLPVAAQQGITIAVEPEPGLLIQTAAEYLAFKQRFFAHDPAVRMNCDIGHLFCVGDDPATVIRTHPGEIAHVHLEDIGDNRVHQHLLPGRGVIDFTAVFESLAAIHYAGWITVELYPYEATAAQIATAAYRHLTPLLRRATAVDD